MNANAQDSNGEDTNENLFGTKTMNHSFRHFKETLGSESETRCLLLQTNIFDTRVITRVGFGWVCAA